MTYSPTRKTSKELGKSGENKTSFWILVGKRRSSVATESVRTSGQKNNCDCWKHIMLFCKYHNVCDKCSLQRNLSWWYLHLHTNSFVSLSDIGPPSNTYLEVLALQLEAQNLTKPFLTSFLNQTFSLATPIHSQVSSEDAKNRAGFHQREDFFKALLSACWSITCMPS